MRCKVIPVGLVGLLVALFLCITVVISEPVKAIPEPDPQDYEVTLPPGTPFRVLLQDYIDTSVSVEGQPISALITQDVFVGTRKLLSKHDRLLGFVQHIEPPIEGRNAILVISFDQLLLSDGVVVPIETQLKNDKEQPYLGGELTGGTRPEIVKYKVWRIGTYGRVVYRGPREMGQHVVLKPGELLTVTLSQPVVLYAI